MVAEDRGPAQSPLAIAVIGTGLIGRKHIGLIAANPKFRLAATVNPSGGPTDIEGMAHVPNYQDCAALLAAETIGAAVIASPNETHADIAVLLIEAGIPVLVEKPITGDIAGGRRIIEASEARGVPVLMGHHRRYNPLVGEMRELAAGDRLGALIGFSGIWSMYKPDPYYEAAWRTGPSGGPIMINLIHEIDYLHAMVGPIVAVGVMPAPKRRAHASEEAVGVLLRFESGVIGSILLSDSAASPWSWEQATGENEPAFPMNGQSPYRFLFQRGAVEFPGLKRWTQSTPSWNLPFEQEDPVRLTTPMRDVFAQQIDHFHDVATGAAAPAVTARDGLHALNVALTIRRALEAGETFVDVPALW